MKTVFRSLLLKILKKMLILFLGCLAVILIIFIVLIFNSSGKVIPFTDNDGNQITASISEKISVNINGKKQGMFIKSKDKNNPVLLFVHGGPGMPEYAISREYPLVLENLFSVCWWEQRGTGMSYSSYLKPDELSFEKLTEDIIEVSNYLRKRFGQEKIYLMAHSGGTFIGMQAAAKAPELFKAYIAVAQISNQLESEKLAYNYMLEQFTLSDNRNMLKKLKKYSVNQINTPSYYAMRDAPMHKLGIGTTHKMKSVFNGIFMPVMLNKEYTLKEKINIWRGKYFTTHKAGLWNKLVNTDLTKLVKKLDIPVYFIHGKYDYTVSYSLAKSYFEKLEATEKAFYAFENSAHSPLFEEPQKMQKTLLEIIKKSELNADSLKANKIIN